MKTQKINSTTLYNFINEATSNIIAEIDKNDYLKKEHLFGVNSSDDLLSRINAMDEQKIFKLFEESVDYCDENVFVLKNDWYCEAANRDAYLLIFKIGEKFYSIYKAYLGEVVDRDVAKDPLPFCEGYILEEKGHEADTIIALSDNPEVSGYDFYFINDLFLNN